jgi:hypothetical protein
MGRVRFGSLSPLLYNYYNKHCTAESKEITVSDINIAALLPLVILALAFVIYCWIDIYRSDVKHLPKWAWSVIALISIPIGGIVYLVVGRENR